MQQELLLNKASTYFLQAPLMAGLFYSSHPILPYHAPAFIFTVPRHGPPFFSNFPFQLPAMRMKIGIIFTVSLCVSALYGQNISTLFELSGGKQTPTYQQIIAWWKNLDQLSKQVKMQTMGPTDAGLPLHLVLISGDGKFDPAEARKESKIILLINNGIHPGEPDGIDASMLLARDIVTGRFALPANMLLAIIPVYNIGGCLDRSRYYRVDQNGPEAFGFRGNSQNLDLNRDFIKCDSKEAGSFAQIFHYCDPDIFIDNHVSDGADYQHVMTLLSTQYNKLGGSMGSYLHNTMEPAIYKLMKEKGYDLIPYVEFAGKTPEDGMNAYFDGPRYSTGYAALWQCFGFMPETHMLKPYKERVLSTYALLQCFISFGSKNAAAIKKLKWQTRQEVVSQQEFPISWTRDREHFDEVSFKGYAAGYKPSEVSGLPRLYYDRNQPYEKKIRYYNYFNVSDSATKPEAYIIPQGWWKLIERLQQNNVRMHKLEFDQEIMVEVYHIDQYQSSARQYEGHHLNSQTSLSRSMEKIHFRKGDYYIPMNQPANRFLMEVLEPQAPDSYFSWNFFDPILGQKEGISSYHFEDIAATYLKEHPELRKKLEDRKAKDSVFAGNGAAQLDFVFRNSIYYEPAHLRYPIYRLVKSEK